MIHASVAGAALDVDRFYTLATTATLAKGAAGYGALAAAERIIDERAAGLTTVQLFARIATLGVIAPAIEGRIVLR